jgi:anthranilate/para-aminobenzoate synthase component II
MMMMMMIIIIIITTKDSCTWNITHNMESTKHDVKELQKTAILGTAHILRKVLM